MATTDLQWYPGLELVELDIHVGIVLKFLFVVSLLQFGVFLSLKNNGEIIRMKLKSEKLLYLHYFGFSFCK